MRNSLCILFNQQYFCASTRQFHGLIFPASLFWFSSIMYYSSKPTGGAGGSFAAENTTRSGHFSKNMTMPSDWMCTICGCVNFARRTSCFQVLTTFSSIIPTFDNWNLQLQSQRSSNYVSGARAVYLAGKESQDLQRG